jgi:hypothetical protein
MICRQAILYLFKNHLKKGVVSCQIAVFLEKQYRETKILLDKTVREQQQRNYTIDVACVRILMINEL